VSLEVDAGEFVVFVGPSGCGKSTLLRLVAGLENPDSGRIVIGERDVTDVHPADRGIAMVFQSYALYPHLTVADNIAFGLRVRNVKREIIEKKVRETAALLELTDYLDRKPARLSGGQRQRVAMGRALVRSPHAFLMDEPLSNLDARLRGQMRAEIAKLQRMSAVTTVYVTHDQVEAMTMGHRVAVMNKGTLQQLDTPRRLYDRPVNLFVASFIGSPPINFLEGTIAAKDGKPVVQLGAFTLSLGAIGERAEIVPGRKVIVGIRPEALKRSGDTGGVGTISARTAFVEDLGATLLVHLDVQGATMIHSTVIEEEKDLMSVRPRLRSMIDSGHPVTTGDMLTFAVDPLAIHIFDAERGMAL
jgi:multiple sugar transport system ATP-binding protein